MSRTGPHDLTVIHRQVLAAKGGHFGALKVSREAPPSLARRAYWKVLDVPGVGRAARRAVEAVRRSGRGS